MLVLTFFTVAFWCATSIRSVAVAQELVPPPVPSSVGQAASEAAAASQAIAAGVGGSGPATVASPAGVGFRPGGFFHALSTTKTNICQKFKNSPLGGLVAEMRKPLSAITGGMVQPTAAPTQADVAAAGPQGTAAQIQAIKVDAPKRVGAIQQLKGIDVRYHPEAAQTLIAALRADPSDCVRLEAARTIATLRTCTKPIAEALRVCVEGAETDGNPAELSPAVQRQAAMALSCCLNCLSDSQSPTVPETRPEYPVSQAGFVPDTFNADHGVVHARLTTASSNYYQQVAQAPRDLVAQVAHRTLSQHQSLLVDPLQGVTADNGDEETNGVDETTTTAGLLEIWKASRR